MRESFILLHFGRKRNGLRYLDFQRLFFFCTSERVKENKHFYMLERNNLPSILVVYMNVEEILGQGLFHSETASFGKCLIQHLFTLDVECNNTEINFYKILISGNTYL